MTHLIVSYIFIAQRELTVSVAFTAISLFSMVRMPLNVIPTFVSSPLPCNRATLIPGGVYPPSARLGQANRGLSPGR
jgi:hypothetical protein